jgi:hypothetical protein
VILRAGFLTNILCAFSSLPFMLQALFIIIIIIIIIIIVIIIAVIYFNCKWVLSCVSATAIGHSTQIAHIKITHRAQKKHSTQNYTMKDTLHKMNRMQIQLIAIPVNTIIINHNENQACYTLNSSSNAMRIFRNCCTRIFPWSSLHSASLRLCNPHSLTGVYHPSPHFTLRH